MSALDIGIVIAYFVFILVVGLISYKKIKNEADYSLASRSLGYPFIIGAITATAIGAGATMGTAGLSYNVGIAALWSVIAYAVGLIGFSFIAFLIRRIKYWTIPEVLKARYGNATRMISAIFLLLGLIALFGVQVAALGTIFTATGNFYGINYEVAVLIAGAVMIAYTFAGGMFALAYTEIVQAILLLVILGIALPIFLFNGVQVSDVIARVPPKMLDFMGGVPPATILAWFLTLTPICLIDVSLWQRASSSKSEKVARRSILVSTLLYFGYSVAIILIGILGFYLYPNLVKDYGTADVIMPVLIMKHLPTVMIGLSIAAILAVVMSTAASVLMVAGVTISRDIARFFKPSMSEKSGLVTARVAVILIGVFGVTFALLMRGIFDMMLLSFALFIAVGFVPTMAALFWNKATNAGAIASMIGGALTIVPLYAFNKPFGIEPIFAALVVSTVLMVVVSLITYKKGVTPRKLSETG
jgi:SSS family solute:Na+ symporter